MINELLSGSVPLCEKIKEARLPVLLYGTGDGAEKIIAFLAENGIVPQGVFASDSFVRGQSFAGFRVMKLAEAEETFGRFCTVICFGMDEEYKTAVAALRARGHCVFAPDLPLFGKEICDSDQEFKKQTF